MMGSGFATGEGRADQAVQAAIDSPLLDNIDLHGASGVLVNITAGADLTSKEFSTIGERVKGIANENATVIIGCIKEEDNLGELRVTLIATGFEETKSADKDNNDSLTAEASSSISNPAIGSISTNPSSTSYNNITTKEATVEKTSVDNIDIPAFLRQQAD
jgi:cell division protein FtsZ